MFDIIPYWVGRWTVALRQFRDNTFVAIFVATDTPPGEQAKVVKLAHVVATFAKP